MFSLASIAWLFVLVAVVAQAQEENSTVTTTCAEWEKDAAAYDKLFAQWQEVDCYNFTYTSLSSYSDGQPVSRAVRYGTKIGPEDGDLFPTFPDMLESILINCFDECPSGVNDFCQIEYATENVTGLLYPVYSNMSEDYIFRLENIHVLDCAAPVEIQPALQDICVNWKANAAAYDEAFAKWQEPECYTFTYIDQSYYALIPHVVQTVRNGTVPLANRELYPVFQTLSDVWTQIDDKCVRNCPTYGAQTCQIEYFSDNESGLVYPSFVRIEFSEDGMCDGVTYEISISPCVELKAGVCIDYEQARSGYYTAMESLSYNIEMMGMECYTYTIERQGQVPEENRGPFQIWVQDGKPGLVDGPSTSIDADMMLTMSDWMAPIDEHCVAGCASDSTLEAYHSCAVENDWDLMLPVRIFFDVDGATTGDEFEYTISDFTTMSCDQGPPIVFTDTKPPSEVTDTKPPSEGTSSSATAVYSGAVIAVISALLYC